MLPAEEPADLLVSSCVLSQVAWPQRVYAKRVYERRFSRVPGPLELRWARHFTDLELRVFPVRSNGYHHSFFLGRR